MRRIRMAAVLALLCPVALTARQSPATTSQPVPVKEIIQRFAAAESENRSVKNNYTFTQDYEVVSLGPGGTVTGRFRRISDIVYGDDGLPIEKIVDFPPSTLAEVRVTYEDIQDLTGIQPFALTLDDVARYRIDYVGKEQIDDTSAYVFDVKPLKFRKGERYLLGRVWVEENDLQIIKVVGRAVPETGGQKFPRFETRRQRVDGHYWFPTYTHADDTLKFKGGNPVHIRMTISYSNYRKFTTAIRVDDDDADKPHKRAAKEKSREPFQIGPAVDANLKISARAGSDDEQKASRLYAETIRLWDEGRYTEAIPVAESMKAILEKSQGPDHPDVAVSLRSLAALYFTTGEVSKAEPLLQRALAIWEKKLGHDHPDLDQPLANLARVYLEKEDYSRAESLLLRAVEITEKARGRESIELEPLLNNLARAYQEKGDFAKAESALQRALEISEKTTDREKADVAASLSNLAALYQFQGKYARAETLFKRALDISEKRVGLEHPDVAARLRELAALYQFQGKYAEAERLFARALTVTENSLGADDIAVTEALTNLADLYSAQGKYAEAAPFYTRAFSVAEKSSGAEHPDILLPLANLLISLYVRGKYAEGESLFKRALAIIEKALGPENKYLAVTATLISNIKGIADHRYTENEPLYKQTLALADKINKLLENAEHSIGIDNPDFAPGLYRLGLFYRAQGKYAEAERLCKRALSITESKLGLDHPEVAATLINLVGVYRDHGRYAEAEPLFKRALAIYEKALGPEHPNVANGLIHLADLYQLQGRYSESEPQYKRALAIYENVLGPEHPFVVECLNALASLHQAQGKYADAESLLKRAIVTVEKALGPQHPHFMSLNNLATLYLSQHKYAEAEPLFKRSLDIMEQTLGPDHPRTALALRNLATLYGDLGKNLESESLFKRSLAICETVFGPEHRDVAISLNNLAALYVTQGKYSEAESMYKRAMAIMEKALGPEHPMFVVGLNNMSVLSQAKGDIRQAIAYLSRSADARERDFNRNLASGSEREKVLYINQSSAELHQAISLHAQSAPDDPSALRLALTVLLRRKSRSLDLMTDSFGTLRRHMVPETRALLDKFTEASSRLSALVLSGPGKMGLTQYRAEVSRLEREVEDLQGEISLRSARFRTQSQTVTIGDIQAVIPQGTALVEFCYYYPVNLKAGRAGKPRYIAYILRSRGEPVWVDLGEAGAIDAAVEAMRRALRNPARGNVKLLARAVDERLMKPVRKLLGQTERVFVSPDAVLNLIPFEALVDERGQYLVERYSFTYLTSGRDLLHVQGRVQSRQEYIIIADPDFDDDGSTSITAKTPIYEKADGRQSADLDGVYFKPLPATAQEAKALEVILSGAKVLTGSGATESAVKQVHSPAILHIATHGFFLADQPATGEPVSQFPGSRALSFARGLRWREPTSATTGAKTGY